ncbi:unnamed protein product [Ectocarpus sp. 8 AP-2014]
MLHLPKEVLQRILDFVKADSYAIIGPVCRDFRDCYRSSERATRTSKYTQSLQLFQQATTANIEFKSLRLLDDLISRDEIDIIPPLLARGYEWDHFCVQRAAETNSYEFFEWLRTTDLPWLVENAHRAAAKEGNSGIMIHLVESGAGFPDSGSCTVTKDCKILQWLRELQLDPAYAFVKAAREDDVRVFQEIEQVFDDPVLSQMCVREACIHGSFNALEFFRTFGDVGPTVSDVAAALHFQEDDVLDWYWEFFPSLAEEL